MIKLILVTGILLFSGCTDYRIAKYNEGLMKKGNELCMNHKGLKGYSALEVLCNDECIIMFTSKHEFTNKDTGS